MSGAAQFFPDEGPDALDSRRWIDDYNQVMTLGALNSTVRTPQQTEIGLFWTEHTGQQYARAFRNLATQKGLGTSDTARLMAMLWAGYADAGIGCWNAKFTFSFWRPCNCNPSGRRQPRPHGRSKLVAAGEYAQPPGVSLRARLRDWGGLDHSRRIFRDSKPHIFRGQQSNW